MNQFNSIEDELIIIPTDTIKLFIGKDNSADLISLYIFYYYTAKWQKTNQIKATDKYAKVVLKWGYDRLGKAKEDLINLKLIETICKRDINGLISGWYIRINYYFKDHLKEKTEGVLLVNEEKITEGKRNTKKKIQDINPEYIRISYLLRDEIKKNNKSALIKESQIMKWVDEVRKMNELDKRTLQDIQDLILWSAKHSFWSTVILSMGSVRKSFDKMTSQKNRNNNLMDRERGLTYEPTKKPVNV